MNKTEIVTQYLVQDIKNRYLSIYESSSLYHVELLEFYTRMALQIIDTGFALYDNLEHTILAVYVGQEILQAKQSCENSVSSQDWLHFVISLLFHDIGYAKGICKNDSVSENLYVTGVGNDRFFVPSTGTNAHLIHHHVDRAKAFIDETFQDKLDIIDPDILKLNIEFTRTPISQKEEYQSTVSLPGLFRSADLISQLSDPHHLDKMIALFYEFEEIGENEKLGFSKPDDLRLNLPNYYWNTVFPYIKDALEYLNTTEEGIKIVRNLYKNILTVELEIQLGYSNPKIISRLIQNKNLDKLNQVSYCIRQSQTFEEVANIDL